VNLYSIKNNNNNNDNNNLPKTIIGSSSLLIWFMQDNKNNKRPGRPKLYDSVNGINLGECLFCYKVYNKNLLSLQQSIIQDTNYCVKCWMTEIMEKVYEDPLDVLIKNFWSGKIDYRQLVNS
jgi:hypothetical protein